MRMSVVGYLSLDVSEMPQILCVKLDRKLKQQ